jgi:hypothetical protein
MPEHDRPPGHKWKTAGEAQPHESEEGEKRYPSDDAGENEREKYQPPKRGLTRKVEAVQQECAWNADHQGNTHRKQGQLQTSLGRLDHSPVVHQSLEPPEGPEAKRPGNNRRVMKRVDNDNDDW